jgi:hypothetical protein
MFHILAVRMVLALPERWTGRIVRVRGEAQPDLPITRESR